ncbi:unnamed protein product, partial [Pleuronectes platessa]
RTISIPTLVRTPDQHSPLQLRAPELHRSSRLSLPDTGITGARHRTPAKASSFQRVERCSSTSPPLWMKKLSPGAVARTSDPSVREAESGGSVELWSSELQRTVLIGCPHLVRCDPTTERYGGFDLLRLRPGPVHPSSDDLVVPGSPRRTISIPTLVRTPDQHSPLQLRAPELHRSSRLSLPDTGITGARHRTRRKLLHSRECSSTSPPLWMKKLSPGAVARTSDPSVREAESGGSVELWSSELQRTVLIGCPHLVRCDPTTERYGGFDLLRLRPGPVHPSSDDLVVPGSPRRTISIPTLVRTPDQHSPLQLRAPELHRSSRLSLPDTGITGARHRTRRKLLHSRECSSTSPPLWMKKLSPGAVARTSDPSVREAESGGSVELWSSELQRTVMIGCPHLVRCDPTTERYGGFDLLRLRPGPVHPSSDDLVVPGSPGRTISIPTLVRTPDQHSPLQLRAPELHRSSRLSLPDTGITGARHRTRRKLLHSRECSSTSPPLWMKKLSPGAVARTSDPSVREAESGGSEDRWSSELQRTVLIGCPHLVRYRYGSSGGARDHQVV